jgi:glucose uptake protein
MFIVDSYTTAVLFCIVTMLCWGSWANTQKLVEGRWPFALFYWDYVIGILLFSLLAAFTLGSMGEKGRGFLVDIAQADIGNMGLALLGGVIFNLANMLLTASIALAGMSVAFPIGIGIALVLGVLVNYLTMAKGDATQLSIGVLLVMLAIVINAVAYHRKARSQSQGSRKGILLAVVAGLLMSFFYRFLAAGMDLNDFENPAAGKMTPYTAFFIFAVGILLSNLLFNTYLMRNPISGEKVDYSDYAKGRASLHLVGILGGCIWGLGNIFNLIAAEKAGPAVSYGLGQGATLVAALWGVLIWKEFKGADASVTRLIYLMFACFVVGLGLIVRAGMS